jgi:hypothetical protein
MESIGMMAAQGLIFKPITAETFVPIKEDIFLSAGSGTQRLIFGAPIEFLDSEMDQIEEFNEFVDKNSYVVPKQYDFRERYRYLQGCGYDHQKTYDSIVAHSKFVAEHLPASPEGVEDLLNSGAFYFYKRDKHFRPVCIINCKKLVKTEMDDDQWLAMTLALVSHVIDTSMRPGQIENWVVIADCKDMGVTEVPKNKIQKMVSTMQNNFRGRLYKMYGVNVPFFFRAIWTLAKQMCDKYTQKKMIMYGSGFEKDLWEAIGANRLEQRYGGDLPDKTDNYWQPDLD